MYISNSYSCKRSLLSWIGASSSSSIDQNYRRINCSSRQSNWSFLCLASSTIRKAIGMVKNQTRISIAKVIGNVPPYLEVLIVKATGHNNEPPEEKYTREILNLTSDSKSYVNACIHTLSIRLSKTHDWIVALKALMLIHRLLVDGVPTFSQEIKGTRILNMSDFHDEVHSNSWEHSGFVKTYAIYLNRKLELMEFDKKVNAFNNSLHFEDRYKDFNGDLNDPVRFRKIKTEKILERLHWLLRVLDRVLSCRPTGNAKSNRIVLIALYLVLKDSFRVYGDVCEMVGVLVDRFSQMEYDIGVKAFDQSVYASRKSDELVDFYKWCKDIGVAKSSEFPNVEKISDELLSGLETVLREKKNVSYNSEKSNNEREMLPNRDFNQFN
ncbi:hypothetical protein L2E82_11962 [Cichorium intybus]|uniref:Uncharacterized protein n=1 Tax=Cichorium intybus TaxID=13427 RepID=A0ACB9GEI0_CICIN|nr:hypothetical protein L2E82_11962 [Cichorium intybus]